MNSSRLKTICESVRNSIDLLAPTTLQTLAAIMPAPAFLVMDQGGDDLSRLGEDLTARNEHAGDGGVIWFVIATATASLAIWWTARMTLSLRFDGRNPAAKLNRAWARWLILWWPRFLGVTPPLVIAWAFFVRIGKYTQTSAWDDFAADKSGPVDLLGLKILVYVHLGMAALLMTFFIIRRCRLKRKPRINITSLSELKEKNPAGLAFHAALLMASLSFIALAWFDTLPVSRTVQVGAMFSFTAAVWVVVGTWLMHLRAYTGLPVLSLLVLCVYTFSFWNDNHKIRLIPPPPRGLPNAALDQEIEAWLAHYPVSADKADGRIHPIFIVASAGGGIRAAYWTAGVLGNCQKSSTPAGKADFAACTFAISGVSGGSIGATVFDALVNDGQLDPVSTSESVLGADHLSPLLIALFFPETIQRLCPFPLNGTDRAADFEQSLEEAYAACTQTNTLAGPFTALWVPGQPDRPVPHLLLNTTLVETGQRAIVSDLNLSGPDFLDIVDLRAQIAPQDIPLSTAGHASARFTYINPQGTLTPDLHFVDGGYFENSGTTTAVEVLRALERVLDRNRTDRRHFVPVLIVISNDVPTGKEDKPDHSLIDLKSPPEALLNTRDARGDWSVVWAHRQQFDLPDWASGSPNPKITTVQVPTIDFALVNEGIPLPLGWSLSKLAARDIDHQIYHEEANVAARAKVIQYLTNFPASDIVSVEGPPETAAVPPTK